MPVPPTTQAQLVSLIYEHQSAAFEHSLLAFDKSFPEELWGDLLQCLRQLLQVRIGVQSIVTCLRDCHRPAGVASAAARPAPGRSLPAAPGGSTKRHLSCTVSQDDTPRTRTQNLYACQCTITTPAQLATDGASPLPERVLLCQLLLNAAASVRARGFVHISC